MKRFDCLKALAAVMREDDLVVTNLGNTMHEWLTLRPSRANLYNMNLGQCTPVALGLALALPHRRVIALDGDGNLLLNLVSFADVSHRKPANLKIFVFDNEAYESPGGMPTATAHGVDLVQIAKGCGIERSFAAANLEEFSRGWNDQRKPAPVRQCENRNGQHRAPALRSDRFQVQQISVRHLHRGDRKEAGVAPALALAIYGEVGSALPGSTSRLVRNWNRSCDGGDRR